MSDSPAIRSLARRLDALLLALLLIARLRIDTLAEAAVLPQRQQDVARQPFLGHLLPPDAMKLLAQQPWTDPIGWLLITAALGCLLAYFLVDEFAGRARAAYRAKLTLIWLIVLLTVFAPSIKLTLLRQGSGPASYSHDGGVIQTEATIDFLLHGRNPYREDYLQTPMAEWGINEFRSALYHYPYLPWTFLFSAPFKLLADRLLGWYDQRFVYLLLFAMTLALLPSLAGGPTKAPAGRPSARQASLLLVMLVGLNPVMGSDLIFGQNDSFVLAWIVLALWFWQHAYARGNGKGWYAASAVAFGLACASKPTAWFLAPFYLLLLAKPAAGGGEAGAAGAAQIRPLPAGHHSLRPAELPEAVLRQIVARGWPTLAVAALVIGPYLLWDPKNMIDDVWRWSAGTSPTGYQIWGWGASNLVLAFGWVQSRFAYWPFWLPELLLGAPLMAALLWRQWRENSPARACWSYALWLFVFFFVSRFFNENYLGYILAFLSLGALSGLGQPPAELPAQEPAAHNGQDAAAEALAHLGLEPAGEVTAADQGTGVRFVPAPGSHPGRGRD